MASCAFSDNGSFPVKGRIFDKDNGYNTYQAIVVVNNVAPTVNAGPDASLFSGQSFGLNAGFSDPGVNDSPWAYTIDWGDGSTGGSTNSQGAGTIVGSRQYLVLGSYTVKVCVTDKDGAQGCDDLRLEVRALPVKIDIKPGSFPNSINLKNKGNVPVGVFTGVYEGLGFDARALVRSSLLFAGAPDLGIGKSPEDLDGDGDLDQVYHFDTQKLVGLSSASTEACLTGVTSGGIYFQGCDSVRIVPP